MEEIGGGEVGGKGTGKRVKEIRKLPKKTPSSIDTTTQIVSTIPPSHIRHHKTT